jgi:hypothetical protein
MPAGTPRLGVAGHTFRETRSFQVPDLYWRLGDETFGQIDDYPPGQSELFMLTKLTEPADPCTASVRTALPKGLDMRDVGSRDDD